MSDNEYKVAYIFPSREVAEQFVSWMCGSGEQFLWEHSTYTGADLNREITYDYVAGSMCIGKRFEEG